MARTIDFYYDVGSTNSYFALYGLRSLAERTGARIHYLPINLGYLFRANNYVLADEPPAKLRHRGRDLQRWAEWMDLPFKIPDRFPIKTSRALRGALAMRAWQQEEAFIVAIFKAYWEQGVIVEEYAPLRRIAEDLGVAGDEFESRSESEEVRNEMIAIHEGAVARGVFGAPTMFVGEEMFWGKDRLDFVARELER